MTHTQAPAHRRQPVFPAAAGLDPQQPVLVLDMDPSPDAEPGTLGFGRLQVSQRHIRQLLCKLLSDGRLAAWSDG